MSFLKKMYLGTGLALALLASCKKDESVVPEAAMGTITGKVVAGNNASPIKVATIFSQSNGKLYITHTDITGSFSLDMPAGNRHITIQTGDGSLFRTEMDVAVVEGQTTQVAANAVQLTQVANLAYIQGSYDKIENILVDSLGYTANPLLWGMLNDISSISSYDAIFINCTTQSDLAQITPQIDSTLAAYVANGGSLYISDWAVKCLVGQRTLSANDPCGVQRQGGFIPDSLLCVRHAGQMGYFYNAPITSTSLQSYLGKTNIDEIYYNLGQWEQINYLDNNFWETLVSNPTNGLPLLIRTTQYTNPGRGTISIGSSSNNGYSSVCTPSAMGNVTLSVKTTDLPAYLSAGATQGMCSNPNGSGTIYFTTFHNEPNGQIGPDIKHILEYVILNL